MFAHEPDTSHADWFTQTDEPWARLCTLGPAGFPSHVRIPHLPGWLRFGSGPVDLESAEGDLDPASLTTLGGILARHTTTPGDCFFALWEGFGGLADQFPAQVMGGPRVSIPARNYLLFRGDLDRVAEWSDPRLQLNSPNLIWPADHAWFVATEIDQSWTAVGGSSSLAQELLGGPLLGVEAIPFPDEPPYTPPD